MSWSVQAQGAAADVKRKVLADIAILKCDEPEQGIKGMVSDLLCETLGSWPADAGVKVEAFGSQSVSTIGDKKRVMNTLKVEVSFLNSWAPPAS